MHRRELRGLSRTQLVVNAYSSLNFVIYPVNANTIIINNYGENITLRTDR